MKHAGLRQRLARSHATRFGLLLLILVVACALSASFWFSSDPRNMAGPICGPARPVIFWAPT